MGEVVTFPKRKKGEKFYTVSFGIVTFASGKGRVAAIQKAMEKLNEALGDADFVVLPEMTTAAPFTEEGEA